MSNTNARSSERITPIWILVQCRLCGAVDRYRAQATTEVITDFVLQIAAHPQTMTHRHEDGSYGLMDVVGWRLEDSIDFAFNESLERSLKNNTAVWSELAKT